MPTMPTFPTTTHSRRHFLASGSLGLGALATAWMAQQQQAQAAPSRPELEPTHFDTVPKSPSGEPRASAMISLWMQGGPSHIDLFDPKPAMAKWHMKAFPGKIKYDNAAQASSKVLHSQWEFRKRGECGTEISELLPHTAGIADEICLIRSMRTGVNNHGQSILALQTGRITKGRPSLGSWMAYGLGTEADDLPAFLAMIDPGQLPVEGVANWSNGWLPAIYQGTVIRPREPRILNLQPPAHLVGDVQRSFLEYVRKLNQKHLARRPAENDLAARIASYQLAARMQTSAREALDISKETKATQQMYGIHEPATSDYGTRCLIARRMVERGVRFVHVYPSPYGVWDSHKALRKNHGTQTAKIDKPVAGLIKDLKRRGLLESTLVVFCTEFGRTPAVEERGGGTDGRDHHPHGFTVWFAGGGVKRGYVHGSTDELGFHADDNGHYITDIHATVLNRMGLDGRRLEVPGRKRLDIDHGQPITDIFS